MEQNDIAKTVELLMLDNNKYDKLENYSVKELEEIALYLYKNNIYKRKDKFQKDALSFLLDIVLCVRFHKINNCFEWSEINVIKFLEMNDLLTKSFEKGYNEAIALAETMEERIKKNDPFLKDYEIEIHVQPYVKCENDDDNYDSFDLVLSEPLSSFYPIEHSIGHSHYDRKTNETPLLLDKTNNWNWEYFCGEFDNHYIGYSIHILLDSKWSFQDILNINRIWTDVKVYYQNYVDIE
jgi:hypothetical protein